MRPVALQVAGFTSFRDEQQIRFDDLELFAITGPTGSGKSSILDAMTYALYGRVERVGDRVSQMISHGQPAMRATFEFDADGQGYRVTRRTPRNGATKILLERKDGEEWTSAGPGSDRVRETEAAIVKLVGLDYVAFTRSILLPQGQFARFLNGDAAERRRIVTELLGLSVYGRMATKAGELSGSAQQGATTREQLLGTEYANVTREALAAARRAGKEAAERQKRLTAARNAVAKLAAAVQANERQRAALEDLEADLSRMRSQLDEAEKRVSQTLGVGSKTEIDLAEISQRWQEAEQLLAGARQEALQLEAELGSPSDIAQRLAAAREYATRLEELLVTTRELEARRAALTVLHEASKRADAEHSQALATSADASTLAERAQDALLEAIRHQSAGELLAGLRAGDRCPACGQPLAADPVAHETSVVRAAEVAKAEAVAAAGTARKVVERTLAAATESQRALDKARAAIDQLAEGLAESEKQAASLGSSLGPAPAEGAPDLVSTLETHLTRLEDARKTVDGLHQSVDDLRVERQRLLDERSSMNQVISAERARLQQLVSASTKARVEQRTSRVLPGRWPKPDELPDSGDELIAACALIGGALGEAGGAVTSAIELSLEEDTRILAEASSRLDGLVEDADSVEGAVAALDEAYAACSLEIGRAKAAAEQLGSRLDARRALESEAAEMRQRAATMHALALHLRSDRLVAFVIEEALLALAESASARLEQLSESRYRLACRGDDFEVVDTWNGDERRNVRTLSGGETFLASLALALGLAEQVAALGVGRRARLDSLFLDEGFGALDAETLDVVIGALELLGADGRMVGVVTHVQELADRLPVRFDVVKSPRGSQVVRVDAMPAAPVG